MDPRWDEIFRRLRLIERKLGIGEGAEEAPKKKAATAEEKPTKAPKAAAKKGTK